MSWCGESGQAMVELALVAPLLLLFVLGTLLFGRLLQAKVGTIAAAREAARVVAEASAEGQGLSLAQQRALDVATGYGLSPGAFRVSIDDGDFARGGTVTVRTSYQVSIGDLPLAGRVVGAGAITVGATDRETIELYRARGP
jgi:Flp pilus assembly protein TadG